MIMPNEAESLMIYKAPSRSHGLTSQIDTRHVTRVWRKMRETHVEQELKGQVLMPSSFQGCMFEIMYSLEVTSQFIIFMLKHKEKAKRERAKKTTKGLEGRNDDEKRSYESLIHSRAQIRFDLQHSLVHNCFITCGRGEKISWTRMTKG